MTQHDALTHVWYTRCPVPTASGLAFSNGWLTEALGADGLQVGILQDGPRELIRHHYDHQLIGLFREGGNVPALAAYSEGAPTRLIGLTWIDELQAILVRPDSGITRPEQLKGKRVAMPVWSDTRGKSFPRAMSLHGIVATLARVGLRYDDVRFVEVPTEAGEAVRTDYQSPDGKSWWHGIDYLARGEVDAVYVKGVLRPLRMRSARASSSVSIWMNIRIPVIASTTVHRVRSPCTSAFWPSTRNWSSGSSRKRSAQPTGPRIISMRCAPSCSAKRSPAQTASSPRTGTTFISRCIRTWLSRGSTCWRGQADFLYAHGFLAHPVDVHAWAAHEPLRLAQQALAKLHVAAV